MTLNTTSLNVTNVSVEFPVLIKKRGSRGLLSAFNLHSLDQVSALRDISFSAKQGDRIGLMGRNGAGKSTLLRAIAGAIPLSSGKIDVTGQITNLLNVGLGMHPEASGYENILLRGLYMGISMRDMKKKIPEIIEFSELEDAIGNPIFTYSAGMRARLQLAIALANEPEILLMDEWLGRGDPEFQKKAAKKLTEYVDKSGILVIASHNERLLFSLCNRIIHLQSGEVIGDSKVTKEEQTRFLTTPRERAIAKKIEQKRLARIREKHQAKIKERIKKRNQIDKRELRKKERTQDEKIREKRKKEIQAEKKVQRKKERIQAERRKQRKRDIQKQKRELRKTSIKKDR